MEAVLEDPNKTQQNNTNADGTANNDPEDTDKDTNKAQIEDNKEAESKGDEHVDKGESSQTKESTPDTNNEKDAETSSTINAEVKKLRAGRAKSGQEKDGADEEEMSESEGSDFDPEVAEKEKKAAKGKKQTKEAPKGRKKAAKKTDSAEKKKKGRKKKKDDEDGEDKDKEENEESTKKKRKKRVTKKKEEVGDAEGGEAAEGEEETEEGEDKKKKSTRKRKKKEEVEEEPKDPSQMTMKELIKNNPNGKPMKSANEDTKKRRKGEPNPFPVMAHITSTPSPATSAPARGPRLVLDGNGNLVLDQSSLVVDRVEEEDERSLDNAQDVGAAQQNITSASFMQRTPSEKWTQSETEKFYKALRTYGTDFTLLEKLFANRTRRQLKNKFKREEKEFPKRIDDALNNRLPLDLDSYQEAAQKATEKKRQLEEQRNQQKAAIQKPDDASAQASSSASPSPSLSTTSTAWESNPLLPAGTKPTPGEKRADANKERVIQVDTQTTQVIEGADDWRNDMNAFDGGYGGYDDYYDDD